jgi:ATP/maltotriose-dependent transcriptional regulator MalT
MPLANNIRLSRSDEVWPHRALVAEGHTNGQIADQLKISRHTAAHDVRSILDKLGLQRRAQIAAWTASHANNVGTPTC